MKERPILFSAPMVRATLDGRKTQTRRAVKLRHDSCGDPIMPNDPRMPCPCGQPGDQLWVKEAFQVLRETCSYEIGEYDVFEWEADLYGDPQTQLLKDCPRGGHRAVIAYRADYEESFEGPWRPSIFMPRWASRITLEVTGVRVERLQDISEADARAEADYLSLFHTHQGLNKWCRRSKQVAPDTLIATNRGGYAALWESINGAGSWDENPWVWVIEFKRIF